MQSRDAGPSVAAPQSPFSVISIELFFACVLGVSIVYFIAARLGLALLAQPSNVAVFWPASGIAAGLLAALGRQARLPISVGVFVGTVAANLFGDRDFVLSVAFGACNAGEAILFAWLLERRFREPIHFQSLDAAMSMLLAAVVSAGVAAVFASQALILLRPQSGTLVEIWRDWWEADAVGIITFAPFFMVVGQEWRNPWTEQDALHGSVGLVSLIAVTAATYLLPPGSEAWWSPLPVAAVFPFLLWLGARCRPSYATAGIMAASLIVVWATTRSLGPFGDSTIPAADRIFTSRLNLVAIAFCGLTMVAAFTQRQTVEAALRANQERFEKLAASAPGMIVSYHISPGGGYTMPYASAAIGNLLGLTPEQVAKDGLEPFRHIHKDDMEHVNETAAEALRTRKPWQAEFRYNHRERGTIWLEGHANPVVEADGSTMWHGFLQDVTRRKKAEEHIKTLMAEVNHRANNLLAVVQAVAFQTSRDTDPKLFSAMLDRRIQALAISHALLVAGGWEGVSIGTLVERQLLFLGGIVGSRITFSGPPAMLNSAAAQAIGMVLHELATNAIKYGALSNESGRIDIRWYVGQPVSKDEGLQFIMSWTEREGPPVSPPIRRGFGHRTLVRMAEHQLDAKVELQYRSSGVSWRMVAPLSRMTEDAFKLGNLPVTGQTASLKVGASASPPSAAGRTDEAPDHR